MVREKDSRWAGLLVAYAFVALLIGNVFPGAGIVSLATFGAIVMAPVLVTGLWKALPRIYPAAVITVPLILILLAPALLSPPTSDYGIDKVAKLATITAYSMLAAGVVSTRMGLRRVAVAWVALGSILAIVTLTLGSDGPLRASAFEANPIWLARALGAALVAAAWLVWRRVLHFLAFLVLGIVLLLAILATDSRGPFIASLVGVAVVGAFAINRIRLVTVAVLCLVGAGMVAWLGLFPPEGIERFFQVVAEPVAVVESSRRGPMWLATAGVIAENPTGVGYGNWSDAAGYNLIQWPHNLFLEVIAEAGWFAGFALIAVTVLVILRLAKRARRDAAAVLAFAWLCEAIIEVSVSGDLNARTFFAFLSLGYCLTQLPSEVTPQVDGRMNRNQKKIHDRKQKPAMFQVRPYRAVYESQR